MDKHCCCSRPTF